MAIPCDHCERVFTTKTAYNSHQAWLKSVTVYCKHCNKLLKEHNKNRHNHSSSHLKKFESTLPKPTDVPRNKRPKSKDEVDIVLTQPFQILLALLILMAYKFDINNNNIVFDITGPCYSYLSCKFRSLCCFVSNDIFSKANYHLDLTKEFDLFNLLTIIKSSGCSLIIGSPPYRSNIYRVLKVLIESVKMVLLKLPLQFISSNKFSGLVPKPKKFHIKSTTYYPHKNNFNQQEVWCLWINGKKCKNPKYEGHFKKLLLENEDVLNKLKSWDENSILKFCILFS